MKALLTLFLLTFGLMLSGAAAQDMAKIDSAFKKFEGFYKESLKKYQIVGSSFAFINNNQVINRQNHGMAHIANDYKIDDDTIYHWASITKTFTGIAIMQLRDRGKLRLDDPVVKYLPELRKVHNPYGDTGEITIAYLLSHTAGFRSATWPWSSGKPWQPAEPPKWENLVTMMPYTEIEFKPGSKYQYSNLGIVFLGRIIELISGEDFEVYMDKNVLKPLGMFNTYYDTTPHHLLRHRSHSYRYSQDGKFSEGRFDMDTGVTVSNGGLNSPVTDMIKYLNFLIGDPKKQPEHDLILRRSSFEEMFKPVMEVLDEPKNGRERKDFIGLAFFVEDNFGQRFIGHSGTQNAFKTHLFYNPATRSGYLIAFNTYNNAAGGDKAATTDRLDQEIKNYLFENIFPLFKK